MRALPSWSVGGSAALVTPCLPSKNEIWSAKIAHFARNAARYDTLTGHITIDMGRVRARKRGMVDRISMADAES